MSLWLFCLACLLSLQQFVDAKLYDLLGERMAADEDKTSKKKKDKPAEVEVVMLERWFFLSQLFPLSCYDGL